MTVQTLLRLAWRESRTARRRLALYMSSIAFGVAALVAIDSFAGNVTRSIRDQSRTLLGGDLSLQARAKFPAVIDTLTDSLRTAGVPASRVTTFASMALAEPSGGTRLVQVRAVSPGYPFYGAIETVPANGWSRVHDDTLVFVDASLLIALDAKVGDRLKLGQQPFTIGGTLGNVPGDAGITAVIGPRVYVSDRWLPQMGLLSFGSRAEYELVLKLPAAQATPKPAAQVARALRRRIDPVDAARIEAAEARGERERNAPGGEGEAGARDTASAAADSAAAAPTATTASRTRVRVRTVADTEREFTEAVARLADFLSIIGLIALLLGGIGVASGVNAFVSAKIDTVAVLRCLGATSRQVLALYVVQAAAMGLVGAIAGAALGVAVQFLLPQVMGDFLPVDVTIALEPRPLLLGLATGVWVSLVFALRPLLALRRVSPLQAIRRNADPAALPSEWKDGARLLVDALLVGSIVAIVLSRVESLRDGLAMTGGIVAVVLILWLAATALIALARRSTHPSWPFPLRQGIANLHRPANQTRAVTLALGFGAFLLSTVYLVQANLLGRLQTTADAAAGNLLLFDVQDDQAAPLDSMLRVRQHPIVQQTPIVTMRVEAINGTSVTKLQGDSTVRRAGWSLRREYRSTYRHDMQPSEKLVSGTWFPDSAALATQRAADPSRPFLLSLEQDVAGEMGVTLGDTITWNVQGVPVTTVLTNTRSVNWGRFEANFFAVFEPAALRRAPQQYVIVANVPTGAPLAEIQRDIVRRYPNVSSLDLTLVKQTIGAIVDRVTLAIRFLGLFSLAMGIPVLFSAVAATRRARLREGVLLRTLGASRTQVARVLLAEYGALGALGALTGMVLSFGGAWAITTFVFEDPFDPAVGPTLLIAGGMLLLTMTIGLLTSRDVYRETPMIAIREPG
ncbi:FtsX-like permease family protein [Gemmatimonas sp.]|jgi:putative ABC transport system permease protein|uniref:ABC transporter permease n=1 Tax=Gemmatimonas sp. TaxID=1962908 RepID=UPI0022C36336|nr:FtsX-like permease family protein [Gemmatimonas sp.]MCA2993281.1 FtsX-like permease family protein [Gemmatimonas sp.]MCE2952746.1 ABC transporter permease [Gemmatimonas sp.]MCZ8011958.1 ABC transporter permease [Gemmatimonas sp.]MCZ8267276.1 ABC transporter permease [Gemmatimonas sp.]